MFVLLFVVTRGSRVMLVLLFSFVTRELGVMFVILFVVCCARVAHNVYSLVCLFVRLLHASGAQCLFFDLFETQESLALFSCSLVCYASLALFIL